jgi:hypothetical protein
MKWLLILWFVGGQSIDGQFKTKSECEVAAAKTRLITPQQALGETKLLMMSVAPVAASCVRGLMAPADGKK